MTLRWAIRAMLVCAAILTAAPAIADDAGSAEAYNHANALYREGDFAGALTAYETLIGSGIGHPDLYYNASNAAYRAGKLGWAILYVERALLLAPSDDDARANLAFLESLKRDEEPAPDNLLAAMLTGWYYHRRADSFALWSALAFATALLLATLALFTTKLRQLALWLATGVLLGVFAFSSGLFALKLHRDMTVMEAIILAPEVTVHSGPGDDNTSVFALHEGTRVVIERFQDGWNLIRLESGAAGWIPSGTTGRI